MCLKKPSDLKVAPELPKYDGYEGILDTPIQSPAMHASLLATSAGKASLYFNYDVLCCFHLAWSYPRTFGINMFFSQKRITQIGNETIESLEPLEPSPTQTLQPLDQWPKAVEAPLTMTMAVPGPEKSDWVKFPKSFIPEFYVFFCLLKLLCHLLRIWQLSHGLARAALLPFFWPQGKVTSDFRVSSLSNGHPWPAGLLPRLEWLAGRKWRPQEKMAQKDVQQIGKCL